MWWECALSLRSVYLSLTASHGLKVSSADLHVVGTAFDRLFESYLRSQIVFAARRIPRHSSFQFSSRAGFCFRCCARQRARSPRFCLSISAKPRNVENLSSFPHTVQKFCPTFHIASILIPAKIFGRFLGWTWYPDNRGQRRNFPLQDPVIGNRNSLLREAFSLGGCRFSCSLFSER